MLLKSSFNEENSTNLCLIDCQVKIVKRVRAKPFDSHCCNTGTAIKHPVPDRIKPSFVIFGIRALSPERQSVRMSKITNDGLTRSGTGCFISVSIMATAGVKGLRAVTWNAHAVVIYQ